MSKPAETAPWARLSRRTMLKAGAGGAAAIIASRALVLEAMAQEQGSYAYFNSTDARTLEALVERLWPETDTPGAVAAGVPNYIDRALIGAYQDLQANYHKGLHTLDQAANELHGGAFRNLSEDQQNELVERLSDDDLPGFDEGQAGAFFSVVHRHTMEGLFADPIYGGNRDFAGWNAVGYPGPFYIISEEQQQSFEPLDMPVQSITDL